MPYSSRYYNKRASINFDIGEWEHRCIQRVKGFRSESGPQPNCSGTTHIWYGMIQVFDGIVEVIDPGLLHSHTNL